MNGPTPEDGRATPDDDAAFDAWLRAATSAPAASDALKARILDAHARTALRPAARDGLFGGLRAIGARLAATRAAPAGALAALGVFGFAAGLSVNAPAAADPALAYAEDAIDAAFNDGEAEWWAVN